MRRVAEQISLKKAQRKKGEPEQVKQEGVKENLLKRKLGLRSWVRCLMTDRRYKCNAKGRRIR